MKKMINKTNVEGYVYQHNLAVKKSENKESKIYGQEFINGSIDIATDEDCVNIVTVYYTCVLPTFGNGNKNSSYDLLKKIIEEGKTVVSDGKENATKVRLTPSVSVNDFYSNRDGEETLVSAKRLEGGFVNIINTVSPKADFEVDMLVTKVTTVEANEERHIEKDYDKVEGYVFNYAGSVFPVSFNLYDEGGMTYFESLDASDKTPTLLNVKGDVVSKITKVKREQEAAFGPAIVKEYEQKFREYRIVTALPPYELGEGTLTGDELKDALQKREIYLADVKKRQEAYQASKTNTAAAPARADNFSW